MAEIDVNMPGAPVGPTATIRQTRTSTDVEMPGCPVGPTNPFWQVKDQPWMDKPNPWLGSPQSVNGGGRIAPPPGKDPDGAGPGSTGVTNTRVPL